MASTSATKAASACNLCGSTDHECVAEKDRDGQPLRTVLCTGCGLVFSDPIPTDEQLAEFYSLQYRRSYKGIDRPKPHHVLRAGRGALNRLENVRSLLPEGGRVLDIGSGGGEFAYLMQSRGYRVTGVEPDLGYGQYSIDEYGIDVRLGPLNTIELQPGSFDLVTTHHVVEHLRDPLGVFQRIYSLLKPGGAFVCEVPNVESTRHAPHHKWHYAHIFNFNPQTMEELGFKAGFDLARNGSHSVNREVRVAFVKTGTPNPRRPSSENYRRVKNALEHHTMLSHYMSGTPWERLANGVRKWWVERRHVAGRDSGRQILDSLYTNPRQCRRAA